MKIPLYQVDAFTSELFRGNPAAVCPLDAWLEDSRLQAIAMENNLSETAFFVRENDVYNIRWFTPRDEVDLCGHATLATAYVIANHVEPGIRTVRFESASGPLTVTIGAKQLSMDFPALTGRLIEPPPALLRGLGREPIEVFNAMYLMAVFTSEAEVANLKPDFTALSRVDSVGVITTAPGDEVDFISRFFAPNQGIPEDPVTGSAHCMLTPYWSAKLGKNQLMARQISARGGELYCEDCGPRVMISGQAMQYLCGEINI